MWQGFVIESKKYMNHPDYWRECDAKPYNPNGYNMWDNRIASMKFWLAFPKAWLRFYWLTLRDIIVGCFRWQT